MSIPIAPLSPDLSSALTSSSHEDGWQGHLDLTFERDRTGQTQLSHVHVKAPLKFQRPFYPEGPVCHGVMLHTAGGIVGGDRLATRIHLGRQSHALITTAAANKVYGSAGPTATQSLTLTLEAGACLEWFPQDAIVFNGAKVHQHLRVDLAENALWMGWEMTRFGRTARQERFTTGDWRSHTEVWQAGRPLWIDPQWLPGGDPMLTSPHGLAGHAVVGSFALLGRSLAPGTSQRARDLWSNQGAGQGDIGVTHLPQGLLCRYRGPSVHEARQWFVSVWSLLRPELCDRPPCIPRVWQR